MKISLLPLIILAGTLAGCSRADCPNMSSEEQKEQVVRYVLGNTFPPLKDVARSDVTFLEGSRRYNADSRLWGWNFQAKGKEYIALIDCDGSVELSIAKETLSP